MKKNIILIFETDVTFIEQLRSQLKQSHPELILLTKNALPQNFGSAQLALVIYNPDLITSQSLDVLFPAIPRLRLGTTSSLPHQDLALPRFNNSKMLPKILSAALSPLSHALPLASEKKRNTLRMLLSFKETEHFKHLNQWFKQIKAHGTKAYHIPLMPAYFIKAYAQNEPDHSELSFPKKIAQLTSLNANTSSIFFKPNFSGIYYLNLPSSADEILDLPIETLRAFILLMKQKMTTDLEPSQTLLDCFALPFKIIHQLAPLCDFIFCAFPKPQDYSSKIAAKELHLLCANLPKYCQVINLNCEGMPL